MSTADSWAAANWNRVLSERSADVYRFLAWAAHTEQAGDRQSLRLADRDDLLALRSVIHLFPQRWWAVCVYSCVDRAEGTRMLARYVPEPVPAELADRLVPPRTAWPARMIGTHRAQAGYRGARTCLMSLCAHRETVREILTANLTFEHAVEALRQLRAAQVGRTTAFDLALHAGQLLHDPPVEPSSAHLHGSTGPAAGFRAIWGIDRSGDRLQAERAEAILRLWIAQWHDVADLMGAQWPWQPFSPGDFENALCIYQDRRLYPRFGTP